MESQGTESIKRQLLEEHARLTKKYMEAKAHFESLLPPVYEVDGKKHEPFIITTEWLEQSDIAEKEVKETLDKLREIRQQIADC
ncbi:hypothetical protein ACFLVP_02725 [Chloroflexota bacterium]